MGVPWTPLNYIIMVPTTQFNQMSFFQIQIFVSIQKIFMYHQLISLAQKPSNHYNYDITTYFPVY